MKIILTGGGTGGHFYPLIAIAEELHKQAKERRLLDAKLYYMAPMPYNEGMLFDNQITFIPTSAGKIRRYFSIRNFFDLFKTGWGLVKAVWKMFTIYPDVVFGKGGYASFPALFAARLLGIPVVIHESDSHPGRVNLWASKFAKKIAISYPEAIEFFPKAKVAYTGNPIRSELREVQSTGAHEYLKLEENVPVILILGGSSGSAQINETLVDALPDLVGTYQIIHQTGKLDAGNAAERSRVVLENNPYAGRYHAFEYLDTLAMRMCAGVADLIISRAGSTIFEIALWGIPSIIIPIPEPVSHDQTKNAYAYARSGACLVIEQINLNRHILVAEITRLMGDEAFKERMKKAAQNFARLDAAELIAKEIIGIALQHEK